MSEAAQGIEAKTTRAVSRRASRTLALALVVALGGAASSRAADTATLSDLSGCSGATDPDCSVPPGSPPPPGGGGGTGELPKVVAWTSAYDINPFNGSKGGIFISFSDGSAQRRLTEFANGNKD